MRVCLKKRIWPALLIGLSVLLTGCGAGAVSETGMQMQETEIVPEEELQKESETETATESGDEAGTEIESENEAGMETEPESETEERLEEPLPPLTLLSEDWGLGFGEEGMQPVGNAPVEELKPWHAYFVGDENCHYIYLTFDCGYENGNTERILDALKKHRAPATFFVVGHFLESEPELVARMAEEGHAVGNHTWSHPDAETLLDPEAFQKELERVEAKFFEITGKELNRYYRPPAGKCIKENLKMAAELGYDTVFWSLAYVDWEQDNQPGHEEAFAKLTGRIHPGAVVLLHNTSTTNGEILDELLTRWEEMGYEFRPLSELIYG